MSLIFFLLFINTATVFTAVASSQLHKKLHNAQVARKVAVAEGNTTVTLLNTLKNKGTWNGTTKLGKKQDGHYWWPGTGGLTPRGTGEVGTKGVEQQRRRLSGIIYKKRFSGQCGDSGGGWGKITSAAACEAGAAAEKELNLWCFYWWRWW